MALFNDKRLRNKAIARLLNGQKSKKARLLKCKIGIKLWWERVQYFLRKLWTNLEKLLVNSRLRLPIYIITIITGVVFFIAHNNFSASIFVTFLGLFVIFESIIPTGNYVFKPLINYFPSKIQIIVVLILKIVGIVLGLYLMFIGLSLLSLRG